MELSEAARTAVEKGYAITRASWPDGLFVWPTNGPECCIISAKGQAPCPRWQPLAEDLIAKDWGIVKESRE